MSSRVSTRCRARVSPVTGECLLCLGDAGLVALVENPLLDLRAPDQAGLGQKLQVLAAGRRPNAELLRDEQRAHAVVDEVAVALRREVGHRVTQPLKDLEAFLVAQGLDEVYVKHNATMANS